MIFLKQKRKNKKKTTFSIKNKKPKNNYLPEYKTLEEFPLKLDQKRFWLAITFKIIVLEILSIAIRQKKNQWR